MSKVTFYLTKAPKKLIFDHQKDFQAWQDSLPEGEAIKAEFIVVKDVRTNKHNRLWWKCIDRLTHLFYDIDLPKTKVHEWAKYTFLAYQESLLGEDITIIPSTKDLTGEQILEAVERMNNWSIQKFEEPLLDDQWKTVFEELKLKRG